MGGKGGVERVGGDSGWVLIGCLQCDDSVRC